MFDHLNSCGGFVSDFLFFFLIFSCIKRGVSKQTNIVFLSAKYIVRRNVNVKKGGFINVFVVAFAGFKKHLVLSIVLVWGWGLWQFAAPVKSSNASRATTAAVCRNYFF